MIRNLDVGISSILIIADTSESAVSLWDEMTVVIRDLIEELSDDVVDQVYLLGSGNALPITYFSSINIPFPGKGSSFVAPLVEHLQSIRQVIRIGIIIGAGEVFDLGDWISSPWVTRWALMRVGGDCIKPPYVEEDLFVNEFDAENVDSLYAWLKTPVSKHHPFIQERISGWDSGDLHWSLDNTGHPMVHVPQLDAYLHLFPVTKPQFERFLVDHPQEYDDNWYKTVLELNPRLSYTTSDFSNYEELLLSGVLPEEAEAFARWQGSEYMLPSIDEWRIAYQWMASQSGCPPSAILGRLGGSEAAHKIWEGLISCIRPCSLLDLSLMHQGMNEWVRGEGEYVGMGRTRPSFRSQLRDPYTDKPVHPIRPDERLKYFGFRLLRR